MRALITNDDGIGSAGLAALARAALEHGWTTVVAAPARESSGTSAGLTAAEDERRVAVERRELAGLPDVPAYAVAAHPAFIALVAAQGAFGGAPDVVLSGVNRGANVGRAVLHSGTVGAALTASLNGARSLAVSLDVGLEPQVEHWATAVAVAAGLFDRLAALPAGTTLNLNVPNRPAVGPPRRASLAEFGMVRSRVKEADDGSITLTSVVVEGELPPGSDAAVLAEGHPTLTPLRSVTEDPDLDV
ncbi:5'/3'-nucleotidase SurE [Actinosynnema sp. NPDC047251]|uniref:5'-nucleotidase n=1 Tax=Saccharothrix espanaensis (strain ATCC 51144 / DSM 44229 / JCM 9112 / NBRC 15066 / NRRL 15764) TaxID=1179773 RepID=K0K5R9_SACES|nr:5'/3'-nucleotidase SurE [Saccharothrix espanaensis]CCH31913.1 Stationary phase survival protein SurE [Saccharothrix espanaensis DSM 44229]